MARSWAASWRAVGIEVAAVGVLAVLGALADEPVGTLLAAVAAALVTAVAGRDAVLRPTLTGGESGLAVRRGPRLAPVPWTDVGRIAGISTVRRFAATRSLEIEVGEELIVLPGHRLGADPREVAEELTRLRRLAS